MKDKLQYDMTYTCDNCGREFKEWFEYGERASQGTCPHCGVAPKREKREPEIW